MDLALDDSDDNTPSFEVGSINVVADDGMVSIEMVDADDECAIVSLNVETARRLAAALTTTCDSIDVGHCGNLN